MDSAFFFLALAGMGVAYYAWQRWLMHREIMSAVTEKAHSLQQLLDVTNKRVADLEDEISCRDDEDEEFLTHPLDYDEEDSSVVPLNSIIEALKAVDHDLRKHERDSRFYLRLLKQLCLMTGTNTLYIDPAFGTQALLNTDDVSVDSTGFHLIPEPMRPHYIDDGMSSDDGAEFDD